MSRDTDISKTNMLNMFDKILIKHLDRLIGSRFPTSKLTLNSLIISCLILLMERENEVKSASSGVSVRYTSETLLSELEEIHFGTDREDMNIAVQDMVEKGYVTVDCDKRFIPEKPSAFMVKLLERAFPGMPGMNLVAYIIQSVEEVASKRKDLNSAVSQFDQVLTIQGVLLDKEQPDPEPTKGSKQSEEQQARIKKSDILGRQKVDNRQRGPRISRSDPKVLSSAAYEGKLRTLDFGKPFLDKDKTNNIIPDIDKQGESERPENQVTGGETKPYNDAEKESFMQNLVEESKIDSTVDKFTETKEVIDDTPDTGSDKEDLIRIDDDIEKRITAFEENLALECPICKQSQVRAEETAMRKTFYRCLAKNCNFISWGKPYHILCPQCNNPFLVETFDKDGKTILKCPRSTCRYRQNLPWEASENTKEIIQPVFQESNKVSPVSRKPRKRVKKRRVVRRKR